jgi:hypothetical protein
VTHVLLPSWLLMRRCDGTAVIGDMLARPRGSGVPVDRGGEGVPEDTVRDRLRRFRRSAGRVREFFTRLAGVLALDPVPLDPAGGVLADAVVAFAAATGRWPGVVARRGSARGVIPEPEARLHGQQEERANYSNRVTTASECAGGLA